MYFEPSSAENNNLADMLVLKLSYGKQPKWYKHQEGWRKYECYN